MMIGSGRIDQVNWPGVQDAYSNHNLWLGETHKFATEREFRRALSFGSLLFVILGRAGRDPVRPSRLPERIHLMLPADHHDLLSPDPARPEHGQRQHADPMIALWIGNARARAHCRSSSYPRSSGIEE